MRRLMHLALPMFVLVVLAWHAHASDKQTITVVADPWCPFTCAKEDGKDGYLIDLVTAALAKHGVTVKYEIVPWTRAVEGTRQGAYDAVVGAFKGDAPDFVFTKKPQVYAENTAWVRLDDAWAYKGAASLEGRKLGAVADYFYGSDMAEYLDKHSGDKMAIQLLGGDNALSLNLRKLLAKRIDVLIEEKHVVQEYYASKGKKLDVKPAGGVVAQHKRLEEEGAYVAFSPAKKDSSQQLAVQLEQGIELMRASGELTRLQKKYGINESSFPENLGKVF